MNGKQKDVAAALVSAAAFLALADRGRRGSVSETEESSFRVFNDMSGALAPAIWPVMQAGSLAAVGVAAAAAWTKNERTAMSLAGAGTAAWALAKVAKRFVRRGRPAQHIDHVKIHGARQRGLGFPSGHSAVAMTLALVGTPLLPRSARPAAWAGVGAVAVGRQYVGAHLPLDVVGGLALGVACGAAGRLVATVA
jgi:glycosyltransferase 2 family protein